MSASTPLLAHAQDIGWVAFPSWSGGDLSGTGSATELTVDAGFLEVGDCFGELSYVGDNRYPASVVAERGACLLRVNEALLKNASGRCQLDFQRVFIKMLVARLASTTQDRSPTR